MENIPIAFDFLLKSISAFCSVRKDKCKWKRWMGGSNDFSIAVYAAYWASSFWAVPFHLPKRLSTPKVPHFGIKKKTFVHCSKEKSWPKVQKKNIFKVGSLSNQNRAWNRTSSRCSNTVPEFLPFLIYLWVLEIRSLLKKYVLH